MGNFYTNMTVLATGGEAVTEQLRRLARDAFVADLGHSCVVYDRECEKQDTEILSALAAQLSTQLATRSFAVLNHDDDVLWFQLYDHSELVRVVPASAPRSPVASSRGVGRGGFRIHRPW